jgi:hypothetical protein
MQYSGREFHAAFRRQVEVADDPRKGGILPRNAAQLGSWPQPRAFTMRICSDDAKFTFDHLIIYGLLLPS